MRSFMGSSPSWTPWTQSRRAPASRTQTAELAPIRTATYRLQLFEAASDLPGDPASATSSAAVNHHDGPPHAGALPFEAQHPAPHAVHVHPQHLALLHRRRPRCIDGSGLVVEPRAAAAAEARPWTPGTCR
jgi:hypothetical protein